MIASDSKKTSPSKASRTVKPVETCRASNGSMMSIKKIPSVSNVLSMKMVGSTLSIGTPWLRLTNQAFTTSPSRTGIM